MRLFQSMVWFVFTTPNKTKTNNFRINIMHDDKRRDPVTQNSDVGTGAVVLAAAAENDDKVMETTPPLTTTNNTTTTNKVVVVDDATTTSSTNNTANNYNINNNVLNEPKSESSKIYYQDSQHLIRQYEEASDAQDVHRIFDIAQCSLVPLAYKEFLTTSWFGVGTLGVGMILYQVMAQLVGSLGPKLFPTNSAVLWRTDVLPPTIASSFVFYALYGLQRQTQVLFDRLRNMALEMHLPKIPSIYLEGGNKGNFIVAIDKPSGKVVGMVGAVKQEGIPEMQSPAAGGQKENADTSSTTNTAAATKSASSSSTTTTTTTTTTDQSNSDRRDDQTNGSGKNNNLGVYELKRMAVDPKFQGRSIGKKLVATLEANLWEQHCQNVRNGASAAGKNDDDPTNMTTTTTTTTTALQIFWTCTNIQRPAHRLYEHAGFVRAQSFRPPPCSTGWLKWTQFGIYRYEKLRTGSLPSPSSS